MAYGTMSDALLELGRFEEAARATQTMVDLKPNLPSYSRASYLAWLQGDARAAKKFARLAIDAGGDTRNPEPLAWVLVQAATLFWNEGDYAGADAGFDRALGAVGEYPPALVGKARVAMGQGDAHRAVSLLERAYKASPLAETAWLLGDARAADGDAKGSLEAYALVVKEAKRTDKRTLAAYAWALYRKHRFTEAGQAMDHALRLGTKDARLLYHAGAIRIATGDVDQGKKLVREALAQNPHFDWTGAAEAAALVAE
jgi:tetratricopeptide (TPR) repeat protein